MYPYSLSRWFHEVIHWIKTHQNIQIFDSHQNKVGKNAIFLSDLVIKSQNNKTRAVLPGAFQGRVFRNQLSK